MSTHKAYEATRLTFELKEEEKIKVSIRFFENLDHVQG